MAELIFSKKYKDIIYEIYNDLPSFDFFELKQTHSTNIIKNIRSNYMCEADGIISFDKLEIPLAIKTADCLPIILIQNKKICFIHAGWKGLSNGILEKVEVTQMNPEQIIIGPHIMTCCFEVSDDFDQHFENGNKYTTINKNKYYFDLSKYTYDHLRSLFPNAYIDQIPACTSCDSSYNSYRRNKTTKRNYNIIKVK